MKLANQVAHSDSPGLRQALSGGALIAAFMLHLIFTSSMLAYLIAIPGPDKTKQVTGLNILGYILGVLLLPFLLPLEEDKEGLRFGLAIRKRAYSKQARLVLVGVLFLPNLIIRLMGEEAWLASPVNSGLMALGNGLIATLVYGCFFTFAGKNRVFWAALSYSAGIFAYHLILGPGSLALMPYVFIGTGLILTISGTLLLVFLAGVKNPEVPQGGENINSTPSVGNNISDSLIRRFSIPLYLFPLFAVFVIFVTNSFTNQLFLSALSVPFQPGFSLPFVVLILALPLLGFLENLWRRRFLNIFLIFCSIVFLLAPSLLLFSRSETLFLVLYTLNLIGIRMNTAIIPAVIVDQYRVTRSQKRPNGRDFLAWLLPVSIYIIHTYAFFPVAPLKLVNAYAVILLTIAAVVYFLLCYKGIISVRAATPDSVPKKPLHESFKEYGLSERETEVALLMVREGLSNKEIGERLFISPNTVRDHVSSIYRKFGVKSRTGFLVKVNN